MNATLLYPLIIVAGALQSLGNAMNAQLRGRLVNPWLAATVSFLPIVFAFATLFLAMELPLPTLGSLHGLPWYAPFGGVAVAVAVFGGLAFVDKIGAGPFNGLVITGNILTSLALDAFGLFGLPASGFKPLPWTGGLLMVAGVVFIARTSAPRDGGEDGGLAGRLLFPFILAAGALQAVGVAWNARLNHGLSNPWLAATVSFLPVVFVFALVFLVRPTPMPRREDVAGMRWWMPLAGLLLVQDVGAGAFNGLLITANLLTSIALDHFGWVGMNRVRVDPERIGGAGAMMAGIASMSVV